MNKKKEDVLEVVGTPTLLMLPARKYKFNVYDGDHIITVPRCGSYAEIDGDHFNEDDGEFHILTEVDDETGEQILYTPSISKVLFGTGKYPDLKDGFAFVPTAFIFKENEVDIIGNVIEMVKD